jgi:ankyrin repeat protein
MSRYDVLREAVRSDDFELFLECHLGILNVTAGDGDHNLLHYSILSGKKNSVQWLLNNGADPEYRNSFGSNCFEVALSTGNTDIIQMVAKSSGINLNAYDNTGHTFVHRCILRGHFNSLKSFIALPEVDFHKPTSNGQQTMSLLMNAPSSDSQKLERLTLFYEWIIRKTDPRITEIPLFQQITNDYTGFQSFANFAHECFYLGPNRSQYDYELLFSTVINSPSNHEHLSKKFNGLDFLTIVMTNIDFNQAYYCKAFNILLETRLFKLENIAQTGRNLFQYFMHEISYSFPTNILNFLDTLNQKTNHEPLVAQATDYHDHQKKKRKDFRRKILSLMTSDVLLAITNSSAIPSKIFNKLNNLAFNWENIIQPGQIIPFKCCNLFVWALDNGYSSIAKAFLRESSTVDWNAFIMTSSCQATTPTRFKRLENCPCGLCHKNDKTTTTDSLLNHDIENDNDRPDPHKAPFSIAMNGGHKLSVVLNLMVTRLEHHIVPFDPSQYFSSSDMKRSPFLQNLMRKGLVRFSSWIQASPYNLIDLVPKSLWKTVCLHEKLAINKCDLSGVPIENIPDDQFYLLMNRIAWNLSDLSNYLKSTTYINSYDTNDKMIDPVFTGPIIDLADVQLAMRHLDDSLPFSDFYHVSNVFKNFTSDDLAKIKRWSSMLVSSGSDFHRELANILTVPELKQWIPLLRKNHLDDSSLIDPVILSTVNQLKDQAFAEMLCWYTETLDDKRKKAFNDFFLSGVFSLQTLMLGQQIDTVSSCLKLQLDLLSKKSNNDVWFHSFQQI